jgi:chloramphenicol 3-O-phosphotransferase
VLQDCVARFKGLPVLFVALQLDADRVLQRIDDRLHDVQKILGREHGARANEGTKRVSRYKCAQIFSHGCFDLVIDTATHSPQEVVAAIASRLQAGEGRAFAALAQKFNVRSAVF